MRTRETAKPDKPTIRNLWPLARLLVFVRPFGFQVRAAGAALIAAAGAVLNFGQVFLKSSIPT